MVPLEFVVFLLCAWQARILVRACPSEAEHYKSYARYWLAMAHKAQGPPLPLARQPGLRRPSHL